jgi:hypothetical protein
LDCHDKILWELSKGKYEKKSFPSINGIGNNSVSLKFYQFAKKRGTWLHLGLFKHTPLKKKWVKYSLCKEKLGTIC